MEYRFLPGGTWTTTPIADPPDDAPKPPPAKPPPAPPPVPAAPAAIDVQEPRDGNPAWPWLATAALLLIAALASIVVVRGKRAG